MLLSTVGGLTPVSKTAFAYFVGKSYFVFSDALKSLFVSQGIDGYKMYEPAVFLLTLFFPLSGLCLSAWLGALASGGKCWFVQAWRTLV